MVFILDIASSNAFLTKHLGMFHESRKSFSVQTSRIFLSEFCINNSDSIPEKREKT